jgi:hypothetical protein
MSVYFCYWLAVALSKTLQRGVNEVGKSVVQLPLRMPALCKRLPAPLANVIEAFDPIFVFNSYTKHWSLTFSSARRAVYQRRILSFAEQYTRL